MTVSSGPGTLPFLRYRRPADVVFAGKQPARLKPCLAAAPFTLDPATIAGATASSFARPGALVSAPAGFDFGRTNATIPGPRAAGRLTARVAHGRRSVTVYGIAPAGFRVTVKVLRDGTTVAVKRAVAHFGAYRVTARVKRDGGYRARVSARNGAASLKTTSRLVRLRRSR